MEAHLLRDQSLPGYKPQNQIQNPRNYNHPLISQISDNFSHWNSTGGGLLHAPPPPSLSYSYPPSVQYYHHRQQPPLLPLPLPVPQNFNPSRARGLSCPPVNRKIKNKNSPPPAQRKSKPNAKSSLENNPVIIDKPSVANGRSAPEPAKSLQSRVLLTNNNNNNNRNNKVVVVVKKQVDDEFSGSVVYTDISPPPASSLPLPTFFLRPKLSCNVEAAAGVDDGATNDLRRLLRLR